MILAKKAKTVMMVSTCRTSLLTLAFVAVIVIISSLVTSCIVPRYVIDSASQTHGYRIFRGSSEDLGVTFEYPDKWKRTSLEKYDTYYKVSLYSRSENASVTISSDMNAANGCEFKNADALIEHDSSQSSEALEFRVIRRGTISEGTAEWHELVYSFRMKGGSTTLIYQWEL